jgi:hypothetical protein
VRTPASNKGEDPIVFNGTLQLSTADGMRGFSLFPPFGTVSAGIPVGPKGLTEPNYKE